jgi:peptidoglycan/xylan/chitin deacetylase (PgdA/CDA1 family)
MRLCLLVLAVLLVGCTGDAGSPNGAAAPPPATKRVAVTLDDLPFADRSASYSEVEKATSSILASLKRHRVPAIGFVNEDRLADTGKREQGIRLLEQWLDAGLELGNHNYGHVGFQSTPLPAYQDAVLRGERETRRLMTRRGQTLRYYRHPFT